jgi:hypothetical protein
VTWKQIDGDQAQLTMTYAGIKASGIYRFNEAGYPVAFEANRWEDFKGKYSLERWHVSITGREFDGIQIGASCEVTWKLKEADFTWLKMNIFEVKYH